MTVKKKAKSKEKFRNYVYSTLTPPVSVCLIFIFIFNSDTVRADIYETIRFLISKLIPTLFPFAIITQILLTQKLKLPFSRCMCNLLGIEDNLLIPLILGITCGFPIGAILVRELYKKGLAEKRQAERIIILSSQPSVAFLLMISKTPGADFSGGKIVLFSLILIFCFLFLSKRNQRKSDYSSVITGQSLSITKCIRNAGEAMINLSYFVIAFSALGSAIKSTLKNTVLCAFVLPFFEITTSVNFISSAAISDNIKLFLIPFSVGFSGLSVFMQIKNILSDTDLEIKKYVPIKLLQGLLSGLFIYLF